MAKCLAPSVGVVDIARPTALARCGGPRPPTWGAVQAQACETDQGRASGRAPRATARRVIGVGRASARRPGSPRQRLGSAVSATAAAALLRKRRTCGLGAQRAFSSRSAHLHRGGSRDVRVVGPAATRG